jgi:hypothetical protein
LVPLHCGRSKKLLETCSNLLMVGSGVRISGIMCHLHVYHPPKINFFSICFVNFDTPNDLCIEFILNFQNLLPPLLHLSEYVCCKLKFETRFKQHFPQYTVGRQDCVITKSNNSIMSHFMNHINDSSLDLLSTFTV